MALPLSYSVRNVWARPLRTAMTVGVIALVVVACTLFLALISSLRRTLVSTGDPLNLVILRKGADNDGSSALPLAAYQAIRYFDGIARDENDRPLVSPELVVQPSLPTREGGRENVLVRGLEPQALGVHRSARVVEGRFFVPSSGEAVIGRGVVDRYVGTGLGETVTIGRRRWHVVGVMEAGGSSFESEIWVDVRELGSDIDRPYPFSGFRLRAASPAALAALEKRIDEDPRFALEAEPETDYYAKQAESANTLYVIVVAVAVLSGVGAAFGAANALYASVQARIAEIGTLRALGFSRATILFAFQAEAITLALLGFALGALLSFVLAAGLRAWLGGVGFGAATFTVNVITLRVGANDLVGAGALALAIGLFAGFGPAWRAARLRPIEALHRA